MNWQDDLNRIAEFFLFGPMDSVTLKEIEKIFQQAHPGPYQLSWVGAGPGYVKGGRLELKFNDEKDMAWWLLQNS